MFHPFWSLNPCGGHGKFMKISAGRDDLLAILNNKVNTVTMHMSTAIILLCE